MTDLSTHYHPWPNGADDPPVAIDRQDAAFTEVLRTRPNLWIACHHPERPLNGEDTTFHDCCAACVLAITAHIALGGQEFTLDTNGNVSDLAAGMAERLAHYGPAPR